MQSRRLGIKEVVDCLRTEIQEIQKKIERGQREPMFRLDQFKIRLGVAVDVKAKAGVNIWVIDTSTDISKLRTHEVEIIMTAAEELEAE